MRVFATVTTDIIVPEAALAQVRTDQTGGVSLFVGQVRDRNAGKDVRLVEYEAYEAMADKELCRIGREIAERTGTRLSLVHRLGPLSVGEVSLVVAAADVHRAEAFAACRQAVEAIKRRLPVWKREHYTDGTSVYLRGCAHHEPGAGEADRAAGDARAHT